MDDLNLNLYNYGARYFGPVIGRWTSPDPMSHLREWVSPYNFVQNNPLNRIDPDGRFDWVINKDNEGEAYETYNFGQREIKQALNISKTQLRRDIHDLLALEYIRQSGGHANRGYQYKVVWWDNIEALREKTKRHLQGQLDQLEIL
ncbi:RHS repeat-associated core domain-containing protein [Cyclobacterium sp. GBPx2]|uniref:RHS repeat-associated core domain-containing protein n=1 Tax=Cyclobacterium plantarum TaxID=2716263 RepID=A0ABX0H7Z9_9BACT|nr:RHS repeat-associated core domain-containing protein [Cyclobacterium plantarum]